MKKNYDKKICICIVTFLIIGLGFIAISLQTPTQAINPNSKQINNGYTDDCESLEVIVDNIIHPQGRISSGEHNVKARFKTVSINVNGEYDENLEDPWIKHEPWLEHTTSPDNTGTPKAHFFTSCDNNYMYLAFKKVLNPIISGQIFLDTNENNQWNGPTIDTLLTFSKPDTKIKNYQGNQITDSKVAWGDFIEIKIPKTIWTDCQNWGYRIRSTHCPPDEPCLLILPDEDETVCSYLEVDTTVNSYYNTTLSNLPPGDYDVKEITYNGWCIESDSTYTPSQQAILYSSICPPDYFPIPSENWSKVNYILNHKNDATITQIQHAIWYYTNLGSDNPGIPDSGTQQLINEANNHPDFTPSSGEILAVILANPENEINEFQHTIIEVTIPNIQSWNPNWGDNSHNSPTPPENAFLNFPCIDNWGCECGVSFKALADIYKIHPGECQTIYKTDFETNEYENEWNPISFDDHSDTWKISTNRSHSSSHSFHSTKNEKYYGNAIDVLELNKSFNFENVVNVTFSFWHWTEGDSYPINGQTKIADYGTIELYLPNQDEWIPINKLALTTQYYDNEWEKTTFSIEKTKEYNLFGNSIDGEALLQDGNTFRFNWTSDAQFQYEGWYIDDVNITTCSQDWYDKDEDLIWQSHNIWCAPFNNTVDKTFPLSWNATEGKYLLNVSTQEEISTSWCGHSWLEKIITVGDIHDVAVTEIDPPAIVEPGDDVDLSATIKNVGTYDETNVEIHAKIRKDGTGSPIWERTKTIERLNESDEFIWDFTWEDATYCDYELEVIAFVEGDEIPANNSKYKWIIVADTLFYDDINDECHWTHKDLSTGEGHWTICTSGYDDYLWCGLQETTKYDNNWNDVALINKTFDLSTNNTLTFSFKTQYELNESDYGVVESSWDNGKHWDQITKITGSSGWKTRTITMPISSADIEKAQFRFRFYSNETITDRGWIIDDVILKTDGYLIFEDDFDTGNTDNWIIRRVRPGDWWQRIEKSKPNNNNNYAWWCGDRRDDQYPHNLNNALILDGSCADDIDLTKAFAADIAFTTWYDMKEDDNGIVELSTNEGDSWTIITTINGTSESWEQELIPIDEYIGETILLRFRFTSDDSGTAEGWYVDDVHIVAKIDETPPATTIDLSGTMNSNDWYRSTVSITLSATDEHSGVDTIYYKLDDGSMQTYTNQIPVTEDGSHTIEYWAVDNVGNTESSSTETFKIDKTNPDTPNITKPDAGIYIKDKKIWPLLNFSIFKWLPPRVFGAITVTIETADETSGIEKVEFYVDDEFENKDETIPYEWFWDETIMLTHTLKVTVTDNAGNTAETTKEVTIFNINIFG